MVFVDSLPSIIFSCYLTSEGKIAFSFCNKRIEHFFRINSDDVLANSDLFFNAIENGSAIRLMLAMAIKTQQPIASVCKLLNGGDAEIWMSIQANFYDDAIYGATFCAVMSDITESHHEKVKAQKGVQFFMYMHDQMPDRFYFKDQNSNYVGGNRSWYNRHGFSRLEDSIGKSDKDSNILSEESKTKIFEEEQEMMRTGIQIHNREHSLNSEGEDVYSDTIKVPLYDEHNVSIGLVGITRDITEQVKSELALAQAKEDAELAARAKSSFLAVMSHEIRTPMNGVIGCASLLKRTALNEDQEQLVQTIKSCGEGLLVIINDILDYSKIEAGKITLENSPFQLRLLVEDCIELFGKQVADKQLEINYYIESDVPLVLNGDTSRIRQIINNLVGNAVKFTSQGEVFVNVCLNSLDEADKMCEIQVSVRDTGIGIPLENHENLFNPFTQADSSITRKFGGTGLGLVICKKIVAQMGGEIWFNSVEGEGTTFFVTFRLAFEAMMPFLQVPDYKTSLKGLRVLIVDDNATNRKVLARTVMQWDMAPTVFDSPASAIENLKFGHEYDLVLLDFCMPKTNGSELAKLIKQHPKMSSKPIIILSSANTQKSEMENVDACLLKPVRNSLLQKTIEKVLGNVPRHETINQYEIALAEKYTHILIVEDNRVNQMVLSMMLKKLGYTHFTCVSDGEDAVSQCQTIDYDIIFMDIQMERMDGYTASRYIRSLDKETQPYIIALTAGVQKEDSDRAFEAGMNAFAMKPLQLEDLKAVMTNADQFVLSRY